MRTKSLAVVLYETRKILIGELITVGLIVLVYTLLDKFHYTVITGSLLGAFVATANIFFMGLSVIKSLDKSTEAEAKKWKLQYQAEDRENRLILDHLIAQNIEIGRAHV